MPDLPPAPVERPTPAVVALAWARQRGWSPATWAAASGVAALVVLGAVVWSAFLGSGSAPNVPVELGLPRATAGDVATSGGSGSGTSDGSDGNDGQAAASIPAVVHVAGAVARPGLYRLGGDPRVADALDAAGGPTAEADLDALNLAAKIGDGERVYVPRRGEVAPAVAGGGPGSTGPGGAAMIVDLNTATADQLEALPGVGPATAEAILAYRSEKGRFRSVDELLEVRGIGPSKLAAIRPKVRVG